MERHSVFARDAGYRKLIIQVRGSNTSAQAFYQGLGFRVVGRLTRQVLIDGVEDDEALDGAVRVAVNRPLTARARLEW